MNTTTFRGRANANTGASLELVPAAAGQQISRVDEQKLDMDLAVMLAKSELVPKVYRDKPSNILLAVGLGRALGLEAAPSLYSLHVIEGTPSPSAKLQQALVRRAGHKFRTIESSSTKAIVQIVRRDDPEFPTTVEFTDTDAVVAGYLDRWAERWVNQNGRNRPERWTLPANIPLEYTVDDLRAAGAPDWALTADIKRRDNWWTNRAAMLHARATTACVGQACSEVLSGLDFDMAYDTPEGPGDVIEGTVEHTEGDVPIGEGVQVGGDLPPAATDVVDAEVVEPTVAAAGAAVTPTVTVDPVTVEPEAEPEPVSDPTPTDQAAWRALGKTHKVTYTQMVQHAQTFADVGTLSELNPQDADRLAAWVTRGGVE